MARQLSEFYSVIFAASQAPTPHTIVVDGGLSKVAILEAMADQDLPAFTAEVGSALLELREVDRASRAADKSATVQDRLRSAVNSAGLGDILRIHQDPSDGSATLTVDGRAPLKLTKGKIADCVQFLDMAQAARKVADAPPKLAAVPKAAK